MSTEKPYCKNCGGLIVAVCEEYGFIDHWKHRSRTRGLACRLFMLMEFTKPAPTEERKP